MKRNLLIVCFTLTLFFQGVTQTITNSGTDFWIAFPRNTSLSATMTIFISSSVATSGLVQSAHPGVDQGFTVVPGIVTQVSLPIDVVLMSGIENKGVHITSNDPICVYGLNERNMSTDAYMALPTEALGMDYRVVNYHTGVSELATALGVVGTHAGTSVSIFNHQTGTTTNITLNAGQTYYLRDPAITHDLTGSRIQSDYPVVVYGSNESTLVTDLCSAADHIIEEMFPYYSWGKNFITSIFAGRNDSGDYFRILAADNGTIISINGIQVATINAGSFYETTMAGLNEITASNPVLVAQFARGSTCSGGVGDPFMMLIPPREQFLMSYTICNVTLAQTSGVQHWVNVVAPDNAIGTIYEDGTLIPSSAFIQVGTTSYYVAQRSVTGGSHTYNSTIPFGVFVYGWAYAESYGYPGGVSMAPIGTVDTITLSPDTAYGQLNITSVCLTAHVMDNLNNSVAGVLVNFHISGIGPMTGNAYTDASGNAQYCYTRTGAVPGTDYVFAEVLGINSDSSVVFWTDGTPCINPTGGGTISGDQAGCGSFSPATLGSVVLPSGQTGTLEFKWQQSVTGGTSGFADIPGSNTPSFTPGPVSQTTWFQRIARASCKTTWDGAAVSNTVEVTVLPVLPVSVTTIPSATTVCAMTSVTFTASPVNGGTTPSYQWQVNGTAAVGTGSVFTYTPLNNDIVTCTLTSSEQCTSGNPATSLPITITVNPNLPVGISVAASSNPVCAGAPVNFTATPVNGGTLPGYQWKVNGTGAGTNSTVFTYAPLNNDIVTCTLTSSEQCTSGNPATAVPVIMTVHPILPVGISVAASSNPVCAGTPVTFTAAPVNGGTLPGYQWNVNGTGTGTNSSVLTYIPLNNDVVTCILSSSGTCTSGNPATSVPVTMTVNPYLPVSVMVTVSANPVCDGIPVNFTAAPVNGGTLPVFQWKVNGTNAGSNTSTWSYLPSNGDVVQCNLSSGLACTTNNPAASNAVAMTVRGNPQVTFSPCFDTITITGAKSFPLRGGLPVGGTYSGPGVSAGYYYPNVAGAGTHTIIYTYTNIASCNAAATARIHQYPGSAFTCGSLLTDLRDGKTYRTVPIGSQCWMRSNLDYGTVIGFQQNQYDNCVAEKYCFGNLASNCTRYGGLYQWDEMMNYEESPTVQGLCPPGWHIPAESEWQTLNNFYEGRELAGRPLQDTLLIQGFRALTGGVFYSSNHWDYLGFATLLWSSESYGSDRAISHGMNVYNFSVSFYPALRANAFPARCLKD